MMKDINFTIHYLNNILRFKKIVITLLLVVVIFGMNAKSIFAQASSSVLYVPLIGITSVPDPLALPGGAGNVTYNYAVKNFLRELPLTNIHVVDDTCSTVTFVEGDDNNNSQLDYKETWRYRCTTKLSQTTQNTATATGIANDITATHKAYSTVVVGSNTPPPLVSVINITKVAYPLSLPAEGGTITFTYKVNNPGVVPLSNVTVIDEKCRAMSGRLGDTNRNNLLDVHETWVYNCTTNLTETTTNTVNVTAYANGLKAVSDATITVKVDASPLAQSSPKFPTTGETSDVKVNPYIKIIVWATLLGILIILIIVFTLIRKGKLWKKQKNLTPLGKGGKTMKVPPLKLLGIVAICAGLLGAGYYFLLLPQINQDKSVKPAPDNLFGWKFPVTKFPLTGPDGKQIAYSDIRDPGGTPQGLPMRLKIPIIGVDSAIEDALITNDGRMDVPAGSKNVAWFSPGPHPGQVGSAVIGGHFGISNGVPWVFYNLDKLKIGDKIYIVDDKDETLAFVVKAIKSFDRNADATTVFTSEDGLAHLNLITCEGIWNKVNDSYPQRLVIFTDSIPSEGGVAVEKEAAFAAKAKNVTMPSQMPPISPEAQAASGPTANASITPQILIASAKSLYATPLDGLITSFLLLAIGFMAFKVIKR